MTEDLYKIRRANPAEMKLLPAIEQAACEMFLETQYADVPDGINTSEQIDLSRDKVWVAIELQTGATVGFAIAYLMEESVYLSELDVHPNHGRRGIGRRLIEAVIAWAREQSVSSITLITFADIPWNGPFYARLGFRTLNRDSVSPTLQDLLKAEAAAGLPMTNRICMELEI
jgi:GNAT superfamily N-acetyltransferase